MKTPLRTGFLSSGATHSRTDQLKTVLLLLNQREGLHVLSAYLHASGYALLECTSPESALTQFKHAARPADLLITDVSAALSREAEVSIDLWIHSGGRLKLLYLSNRPVGHWSVFVTALFLKLPRESVRVLQKPFSVLHLLIQVNELIGLPENRIERQASV